MGWAGLPSPFGPARTIDAAYPRHLAQLAVDVPAELQVVGVNKILQSRPVTLEPRVRLYRIQNRANVLVLDVAYWQTNLDVAIDSCGEGALNGLEVLLDHRVVADIKYLAAAGLDQQTSPID